MSYSVMMIDEMYIYFTINFLVFYSFSTYYQTYLVKHFNVPTLLQLKMISTWKTNTVDYT